MMMHKVASLVLVLLLLCVAPRTTVAWGQEGHAIVADIATAFLTNAAANKAKTYLPAGKTIVDIASLADQYRETSAGSWSAALHYVNMLTGQTSFDMTRDCATGCVVSAIQNYTARLSGSKGADAWLPEIMPLTKEDQWRNFIDRDVDANLPSVAVEPNAFEFLVHFIGDVHQPLHVGWASDLGGNKIPVHWYQNSTNLHAVWDVSIITHYKNTYSAFSAELIQTLKSNSSLIPSYTKSLNCIDWANESFDFVRNQVYQFGTTGYNLGDWYYNNNLQVVKNRLMAAGIRLAYVLNSILK
eukprot:TRINITY_DN683_c0_g1_i1.p1 TRINITY_DN683_c0_g1~~TRINITY_DN683_c0_g1_i1.p1  ORF type:complete len:324 (-),score=85.09 TRINITY_DN683_c0_g1_i1:43-939(-)